MDWNLILPWLIAGLAIGWFIEFLIDYFFWRRKCEASTASANAELSTLKGSIKGMEAELAGAQSTRASLEASVGDIQGKYDDVIGRVGFLAGAGGALGAIGGWLGRGGNDTEFKAQIADVNASLKAKSELETQVGELSAKLNNANAGISAEFEKELGKLHEQFKAERNAKADLESRIDQLQANIKANPDLDIELDNLRGELEAERQAKADLETRLQTVGGERGGITENRLGLLAGAGGLAAGLSAAFQSDDDAELKARVNELNAQLAIKDGLEKELGQLRSQLDAERSTQAEFEARIGELQQQVDAKAELNAELSDLRGQLEAERSLKLELENDVERLQTDLSANAQLDIELDQLRSELETTSSAKAELEARIASLEGELHSRNEAVNNLENELGQLRGQLDIERNAKANLEGQINLMHGQLEAERNAKAEVEAADSSRTVNRLGLMAGAGGLVAGLGAAFQSDDDAEIEERLSELDAELKAKADLENRINALQVELDAAQGVANEYDAKINELNRANGEFEARIGSLEGDLHHRNEAVDNLENELGQLRDQLDAERSAKAEFEARIGSLEGELHSRNEAVDNLENELGQLRGQLDAERSAKAEFEARIASLEGELDHRNEAANNLENELGQLRGQLEAERNAKAEFEARIGSLEGELHNRNEAVNNLENELGQLRGQLDTERQAKVEFEARIGSLEGELHNRNEATNNLENELGQLRGQLDEERSTKANLEGQINLLHGQIETERSAKAEIESADSSRTINRFGLLAGAGGLVASLGAAFQSDDDSELELRLGELDAELQAKANLENELEQLRGQLDAERNAKAEFETRIGSLEGELHNRNEAANNLENELAQLRVQLEAEIKERKASDDHIDLLLGDLNATTEAHENAEAQLGHLRGQLDLERSAKAEFESRLGSLQNDLNAKSEVNTNLEAELGQLRGELEEARNAKAKYEVRIVNLEGELTTRVEASNNLEAELNELRSQLNEERNAKVNLEGQINLMHGQLEAERQAKAEVETVDTSRTLNRFSMLTSTSGLVAGLGAAFHADDDSELESRLRELETELQAKADLEVQLSTVQAELNAAQSVAHEYDSEINDLKATNAELTRQLGEVPSFKWIDATDDLKLINGIGPVMERRLNKAGITTYAQIASSDPADLYRIAEAKEWQKVDTADWIAQARDMKSSGKVMILADGTTVGQEGDELRTSLNSALSEVARLKAEVAAKPKVPRESKKTKAQLSAANSELAAAKKEINVLNEKLSAVPNFKWVDAKDDLKLINGIGPVMERRLNEAGITTYKQVANTSPDELYRFAEAKEWQNVDTADWIAQARDMKSSGKVMLLEDGMTVGREGDQLRQSLNDAVAEVARLKAEVKAKPKAPRQSPDRKLKAQLDAASAEIQRLRSGAVRRGRDLLQAIDGIDEAIENRFYNNEITTYLELSEHGDDNLRSIAKVEEDVNITLWIRQANEILASQRRGYNRLQDINGIGAEYQARLFDNGYYTYYDIANATEDELRNAIYVEGETVSANYRSWIHQANEIVGGTFITGTRGRIGAGGWAVDQTHSDERDRLIDINGVGPIYQRRLYAAGIYTFEQLIAATNERLHEVCRIQEWQEVDLNDWKAQASQLAQAK